jgi:hypothetical protein
MKKIIAIASLLLATFGCVYADPATDSVTAAMQRGASGSGAEQLFLQKTTKFVVPDHSQNRLTSMETYGGAKFAYVFARDMINFFEKNGYPNLRQNLQNGSTDQLDEIAKNFTFTYVYEGPDDEKAWRMFKNYSAQIVDEVYHWGWLPTSGQAHITVVTTPKAPGFSATSDGKQFTVRNPVLEIPTSQWNKNVRPVFDKYGKKANRI